MAIQSLQKIIQLENELCRNEELAQEKISTWIKEQQAEIAKDYDQQVAKLELKRKKIQEKVKADAEAKADAILSEATKKAEYLEKLDTAFLKKSLHNILPLIKGQDS